MINSFFVVDAAFGKPYRGIEKPPEPSEGAAADSSIADPNRSPSTPSESSSGTSASFTHPLLALAVSATGGVDPEVDELQKQSSDERSECLEPDADAHEAVAAGGDSKDGSAATASDSEDASARDASMTSDGVADLDEATAEASAARPPFAKSARFGGGPTTRFSPRKWNKPLDGMLVSPNKRTKRCGGTREGGVTPEIEMTMSGIPISRPHLAGLPWSMPIFGTTNQGAEAFVPTQHHQHIQANTQRPHPFQQMQPLVTLTKEMWPPPTLVTSQAAIHATYQQQQHRLQQQSMIAQGFFPVPQAQQAAVVTTSVPPGFVPVQPVAARLHHIEPMMAPGAPFAKYFPAQQLQHQQPFIVAPPGFISPQPVLGMVSNTGVVPQGYIFNQDLVTKQQTQVFYQGMANNQVRAAPIPLNTIQVQQHPLGPYAMAGDVAPQPHAMMSAQQQLHAAAAPAVAGSNPININMASSAPNPQVQSFLPQLQRQAYEPKVIHNPSNAMKKVNRYEYQQLSDGTYLVRYSDAGINSTYMSMKTLF